MENYYNFKNITWDELTSFDNNLTHKTRPIIIIDLQDKLKRKYNAIVVKYDQNKNVLIRYLNNPQYDKTFWWTGNKKNKLGLNPEIYTNTRLNEFPNIKDLEITSSDFAKNGYDDIINYNEEPFRFYKTMIEYPFLNGVEGNVYINHYYNNNYKYLNRIQYQKPTDKFNINGSKLPSKLNKLLNYNSECHWRRYYNSGSIFNCIVSPLIKSKIKITKKNKKMLKKVTINNYINRLLTNSMINEISNIYNISVKYISEVKCKLVNNNQYIFTEFDLRIFAYLFNFNFIVFYYNDKYDIEINKITNNKKNPFILLYKLNNDKYEIMCNNNIKVFNLNNELHYKLNYL